MEILLTYMSSPRPRGHALIELSTKKMAQRDSGLSVETTGEGGHRSGGSYTVTLDTNPSVEQVQTYMTKPLSPTGYVPSSSDFDFMSSSLGSPSGTIYIYIIENRDAFRTFISTRIS